MQLPHPYRYPAAFRAQLARLERLSPGVTTDETLASPSSRFVEIEHAGATVEDIAERNRRLRHLEGLIADWHSDGGTVSALMIQELDATASSALIELDSVPASVSYFELEPLAFFGLTEQPQSRIEGFYVREVIAGGRFCAEITIVCDEPAWRTMGTCLYADAMEVGSRIGVGLIPLGEVFYLVDAGRLFNGDAMLLAEPALLQAIAAVGTCLSEDLRKIPTCSPMSSRMR